jgi:hypothetical protein
LDIIQGESKMRESCLSCVSKHIAKAIILLSESELGYPTHKYLALGNLSEAEDECLTSYPDLAKRIRRIRLQIEKDTIHGVKLNSILKTIIKLVEDEVEYEM